MVDGAQPYVDEPEGAALMRPDTDVVDYSGAEADAQAAQWLVALEAITGGLAHDFRNILAVIDSGLRLIASHPEQVDKILSFVDGAREGVTRGMKLTSQLMSVARQPQSSPIAGNVNELLREIERFLSYGAGPGINVILELAPDTPPCLNIPSQFGAAMLNLVMNARDAMPNGGDIRISTERCEAQAFLSHALGHGVYVRVRVRDSGKGMSAGVLQRVFDPFFTTKGEKGNGLGLPQVCAFIRRVGGDVTVISELDRGTTFDLLFPAQQV
ncbi:MAG: ATP-binding protein [Dehalococcoidia bacterium]